MVSPDFKMARLQSACRRARLDLQELIEQCRTGEAQFFDNEDASAIGAIVTSGANRVYYIMVAGGTLEGVRALLPEIEAFAKEQDCQAISAHCRLGALKADPQGGGFKVKSVLYEKVI